MIWEYLKINGALVAIPPKLEVGHSFFVPSIKHKDTYNAVGITYRKYGYALTWAERIERGVLGIRVWRTA
jgi:hypothetical protein